MRGNLEIKIKYSEGMEPIKQAHEGEWYDLRAAKDYCYVKGDIVKISLGVAIQLPDGYEAIIRQRSSLAGKYGLMMACSGVIDNLYCGDDDIWSFQGYAIQSGLVKKNDRICQFRIEKIQPTAEIVKVEKLGNENRGGFGSTGVK